MFISPETIKSEVIDAINDIVGRGVVLRPDDEQVQAISREISKLALVDPQAAQLAQALLLQSVGKFDEGLELLQLAAKPDVLARLCILLNCGKATAAQEVYRLECAPTSGRFLRSLHFGTGSGALHQVGDFLREAEKMSYENIDPEFKREIYMATDLLEEFGVSDAEIASVIDTAGSVIHDNGVMFVGDGPGIDVFDIPGELRAIHYTYNLPVDSEKAVDMYMEFVERMAAKHQTFPLGFHVAFAGALA